MYCIIVDMNTLQAYEQKRNRIAEQYKQLRDAGQPVRLKKPSSNVFRMRRSAAAPRLDVSDLNGVIRVDTTKKIAEVEGMATYRTIVDETLKHGMLPTVVPELATITAGGAVSGGGIEASSFRYGLVHESVESMELLLPSGEVVTATAKNKYSDLFHSIPNSYGTLGYILKLTIRLMPAKQFVHLEHYPFSDMTVLMRTIDDIAKKGTYRGKHVDFVEATGFEKDKLFLTISTFSDVAPDGPSDYTYMRQFYKTIPQRKDDYLTARDFIWRWDTDWFWCSSGFLMHRPLVRFLLGKWMLRSESYWHLLRLNQKHKIEKRLRKLSGKPPAEVVVQDVQIPIENAPAFWQFFTKNVPILPVWFCPTRSDNSGAFPHIGMESHKTYVNFGFWEHIPAKPGDDPKYYNHLIEKEVAKLKGTKGLYAEVFYNKAEFGRMYNTAAYDVVKAKYDPDKRLKGLYDKCVGEQENY
jgi:FAD/FMN-containing dehydrogenase